jgi:hypothetical protein
MRGKIRRQRTRACKYLPRGKENQDQNGEEAGEREKEKTGVMYGPSIAARRKDGQSQVASIGRKEVGGVSVEALIVDQLEIQVVEKERPQNALDDGAKRVRSKDRTRKITRKKGESRHMSGVTKPATTQKR